MVDPFSRTAPASGVAGVGYDAGLRAQMQRVFNYMAAGLGITGLVAAIVAYSPLREVIFGNSIISLIVMLSPLAFLVFGMNVHSQGMSAATAKSRFWIFCTLMGLSMSTIFLVYTGESIVSAFFITAGTFGAMSLWGYTTKRDLTGMGAFLMMGMLGLFIASIVNLFMSSAMLSWVVSVAGVAIFTGLTAYQVQIIKQTYSESWGVEANNKFAVVSALGLYLNFINAFQFLLSLIGNRR